MLVTGAAAVVTGARALAAVDWAEAEPLVTGASAVAAGDTAPVTDGRISVDLKNVTCVDRSGRSLLQLMHSRGVEFLRAGMAIQDILSEVMERPAC